MKIIYIGAFRLPNLDAAAPRVLNNAKVFRALGHEICFISWGGQYRIEDLCNDGKYRVCGFEYRISGDLPMQNSIKERIKAKIFRGERSIKILNTMSKPDLIILYNAGNSFSNRMIKYCKKNDIKLANDINEWFSNNELHITDILPNYINMKYTQHKIKNKIVISKFLYGCYPDSHNVLIPPLCDPEEPKWNIIVEDKRVEPFNGYTLIYAGTPAKKDYIHSIINAVNTLAHSGKCIRFLILGITREAYLSQHSNLLMNPTLHKNIIFLGRISQDLVPAYYKKADFMVFLREPNRKSMAGFPTKVAESLTAGVPVITNATSDLKDYIINGETGFLLKKYDYDSILDILQNSVLNVNKDNIENMRKHVRSVSPAFDWHRRTTDFKIFLNNLK